MRMITAVKIKFLNGKKGLVVGIANDMSIACGSAKAFRAFGAEVAITYPNDKAWPQVEPLARVLETPFYLSLDLRVDTPVEAVFNRIAGVWEELDFVVHSIAFSPKRTLRGQMTNVGKEGFADAMEVSCWYLLRVARLAELLMKCGSNLFTMTYCGSKMVVENYNIMGAAKAALRSAVRYLAAELGPKGIRAHAISPGLLMIQPS
jgi:enoyl-[acyl-carrier protein] reductase I